MSVPQLEIQPFLLGADDPGAPVAVLDLVQKSLLIPHWPCLFARRVSYELVNETRGAHTASIEQARVQACQRCTQPWLF